MADRRRGELRQIKKDSNVQRDTLNELGGEITQDRTEAQYRNANRDQARGDWDRSGRRSSPRNTSAWWRTRSSRSSA